jgi:tetratricopeptide (TPR) repeat protein
VTASARYEADEPAGTTHLTAVATEGARVVQAAGDVRFTEVHHHQPAPDAVVLVERILPTAEAVGEVFVGRGTEVDSVLGVLDPTHEASAMVVVSAVAGLAGIGKTALARVAAAEAVARGWFPGGAVFVDLNGYALQPEQRVGAHQMYGPLLHALDEGAADTVAPGHQAVQYHRLLDDLAAQRHSVLLVLDNASTTDQIAGLLPRSRRHRVVVTSRHTLTVRSSRTLDLQTLADRDSLTLVQRQLEQLSAWNPHVHDDEAGLVRLCDLCGHLPLALHIATALLAGAPGLTPAELADELAQAHSRLDVLDDGERAVRAAFDLSYHRLAGESARLFRLLPLNPGPHFGIEAAAELLGSPTFKARAPLHELARAHVIESVGPDSWRQHDLIRDYAIELMAAYRDDQKDPSERLLRHYAAKAADAGRVLRAAQGRESDTVRDTLAWLDHEQPNLQAAVGMGLTFDNTDAALRILQAFAQLHRHRGQLTEVAKTAVRMADVASSDPQNSAWSLTGRAWELGAWAGEHDRATAELLDFDGDLLRSSLDVARDAACAQLTDLWETVRHIPPRLPTPEQLAVIPLFHEITRTAHVRVLGSPSLVAEPVEAALDLARRHGDRFLESFCQLMKVRYCLGTRSVDELLPALEAAVEPLAHSGSADTSQKENMGRLLTEAALDMARGALASTAQERSKHWDQAARLSLTAWRNLGFPDHAVATLSRFAELHHYSGRYAKAAHMYTEAIDAYEKLNRRRDVARTLVNLSAAQTELGRHDSAVVAARRAADLFATDRDLPGESRAKTWLAHGLLALGRPQQAVFAATEAQKAASATSDGELRVSAGVALALALEKSGRIADAKRTAAHTLDLVMRVGDAALHSHTYHQLQHLSPP